MVVVVSLFFIFANKEIGDNAQQTKDPSADYCVEKGFKYEVRTSSTGEQKGVCVFPDKTECSSWSYFCGCTNNPQYCGVNYGECSYKC